MKKQKLMKKNLILYSGESNSFMDNTSFEQISVPNVIIGNKINYLEKRRM